MRRAADACRAPRRTAVGEVLGGDRAFARRREGREAPDRDARAADRDGAGLFRDGSGRAGDHRPGVLHAHGRGVRPGLGLGRGAADGVRVHRAVPPLCRRLALGAYVGVRRAGAGRGPGGGGRAAADVGADGRRRDRRPDGRGDVRRAVARWNQDLRRGAAAVSRLKNPIAKYFLARLGLFAAIALPLAFFMNVLLALAIALMGSMLLSFVLLKAMREQMVDHIDANVKQRREEKQKLRAELNGDA
ncbi:DUF4229 domain-containing protein [Glycomyces buryatensis]|uniref:DUF4229 domain-containing protein n=1 Tax=Glycomyces buryatensis TaxID=2570927 RepID=A0A4S8QE27_9ACTN|nr:DUF4229 domain-containing protein [Glycomyces buryatensis]